MKSYNRYLPTLTQLEDRCLLASSVLNATLTTDGTLRVFGTDNADTIIVQQTGNQVSVKGINILSGGNLVPTLNVTDVKKIEIYGYGGNDVINAEAVNIPSSIFGGDGDDILIGSQTADYLYGGNGNDQIWGRAGNDRLYGEAGNDTLYGENGNDILIGGAGRDQFIGGNPTSPASDFDLYKDDFDLTKPIQDGATVSDVVQQRANNCQTLAALATMASQSGAAAFQNNIKYLGGTSFQVNLPGGGGWVNVTFDGTWSDTDARPSGMATMDQPEFWTLIMNRARLSTFGINCLAQYSDARWDQIDAQSGYRLKSIQNALYQFTGQYAVVATMSQMNFSYLQWALSFNEYVAAASYYSPTSGTNSLGIVANHAYAVTRAFTVNGAQYVELYNPWGTDSKGNVTIDTAPGSVQANDGFITISWNTFLTNFAQVVLC